MKRAAQHDAGDDDDHRRNAHSPSARVSYGLAIMSQAAATNNGRSHIPRVIRNAVDEACERTPRAGYGPAVPIQMAGAHCWVRYDDVVPALRSLGNLSLLEMPARDRARAIIEGLFKSTKPFDTDVRFPDSAIFLTLDHGEFGQRVRWIQKELLRIEAATSGLAPQRGRIVSACEAFMDAVSHATGTVTGVAGAAREAGAV